MSSNEDVLRNARTLVERVRAKLQRRRSQEIFVAILFAAGLIAAIPLFCGKLRILKPVLREEIPLLALAVATLVAYGLARLSRPKTAEAARFLDQETSSKALFMTAIDDSLFGHGHAAEDFFCGSLDKVTKAITPEKLLPSTSGPLIRALVLVCLLDLVLWATPARLAQVEPEVRDIKLFLSDFESRLDEDTASRHVIEILKQANSEEDLLRHATDQWRNLKIDEQVDSQTLERALRKFQQAVAAGKTDDVAAKAKKLQQEIAKSQKAQDLHDLAAKLDSMGEENLAADTKEKAANLAQAARSQAGKAGSFATGNRQDDSEHRRVKDLLLTVFNGLGKRPPSATKSASRARQNKTPQKRLNLTNMQIRKFEARDRDLSEKYFRLRPRLNK